MRTSYYSADVASVFKEVVFFLLARLVVAAPTSVLHHHTRAAGVWNGKTRDRETCRHAGAQCPALVRLNLTESVAISISDQTGQRGLQECWDSDGIWYISISADNEYRADWAGIDDVGVESLAGVLDHLKFSDNKIGAGRVNRLAGVLKQCPALAHHNLCANNIGAVGGGRLRASWCGQAAGLLLTRTRTRTRTSTRTKSKRRYRYTSFLGGGGGGACTAS